MIGSLVRWFRRAAAMKRSRRGAGSAPRFTPRLEALEERAVPGGAAGGIDRPRDHVPAQAALLGGTRPGTEIGILGRPGTEVGLLGSRPGSDTALLGSRPGSDTALLGGRQVTPFGSRLGLTGSGDSGIALSGGSEVTLFGVKAGTIGAGDGLSGGIEVTPFGSRLGLTGSGDAG